MGFKHVNAALLADLKQQNGIDTHVLKLVLVAICQHADNKTHQCFPSTRRLAQMTQLARSSVSKAIDYLNGMGCFTVCHKGNIHGMKPQYVVDLARLEDWRKKFDRSQDDQSEEEGVSVGRSGEVVGRTQEVVARSKRSQGDHNLSLTDSFNPSMNLSTTTPPAAAVVKSEEQNKKANQSNHLPAALASESKSKAKPTSGRCPWCSTEPPYEHHKTCPRHPKAKGAGVAER